MPKILRAIGAGTAGFMLAFLGLFLLSAAIYWPLQWLGVDAAGVPIILNFACIPVCPLVGLYYGRKAYKRKK